MKSLARISLRSSFDGLGAAVAVVALLSTPAGAQTCLDDALGVETANRSETHYLFDLPDQAVDARDVHWVGIEGHAIQPAGPEPACWVGGDVEGPYGEASVYECQPIHCPPEGCPDPCLAFHTTAGMRADTAAATIVEDLRVSGYGDGIERGEDALRAPLVVKRAYLHDIKDDAIENDWGASVSVLDSLLERVNTAFASRPRSSAQIDARDRVFEVRDTLVLLHSFAYSREMEPGHGKFWKWAKDGTGPSFIVSGNTFVVTDFAGGLILPLADQVLECADNTLLWADTLAHYDAWLADPELGSDGLTAAGRLVALSHCYTLVVKPESQSRADFLAQHFDPLVDAWKATHPAAVRTDPLPFACEDQIDNDLDGAVDYPADLGCEGLLDDSEDSEGNVTDDDGDGHLSTDDCNDLDPAIHPDATELCADGVDNDCDEKTDCSDKADCGKQPECDDGGGGDPGPAPTPEVCNDGVDNDGDGKADCEDRKDCRRDPAC